MTFYSKWKKRGTVSHPHSLIKGFREAVEECELEGVRMVGNRFTWERSRGGPNWVEEKLDRCLANSGWFDLFLLAKVINEDTTSSDQTAIIFELGRQRPTGYRKFRFKNNWVGHLECRNIISQG